MRKKLFVRLSMWDNATQNYYPVGTLLYDKNPLQRDGFVGFSYDRDYLTLKLPSVDPAHLQTDKDDGRFVCKRGKGKVHHYFTSFLPGEFGQKLLNDIDERWEKFSEAERLYAISFTNGDFGAPQINPHFKEDGKPVRGEDELNLVVESILKYMRGEKGPVIAKEFHGAICTFSGIKPKVDYQSPRHEDSRFVAKINTSRFFNDAKIANVLTAVEVNANIDTCNDLVVSLECGTDVLLSSNYTRKIENSQENNGAGGPMIYKYNRLSFKTLLADSDILKHTEKPNYSHLVRAIKRYSCNQVADLEELFKRAIFSAAVNHTSNGLENYEMYDTGGGKWRLSPSFHNLPLPEKNTEFAVSFFDSAVSGQTLSINERFIIRLGTDFDLQPAEAMANAYVVLSAVNGAERIMDMKALDDNDKFYLSECIHRDVAETVKSLSSNPQVVNHLASKSNGMGLEETDFDEVVEVEVPTSPRKGSSPSM